MVAKRFFYVCAGLLCLAFAYHLGARSATAQAGSAVSGFTFVSTVIGCGYATVMTPNGDVYQRGMCAGTPTGPLEYIGNMWSGPTPATQETWGGVKARYRQDGTAKQAQDR